VSAARAFENGSGPGAAHTFTALGVGRHAFAVIDYLLKAGRWQLVSASDRSAAAYARFQSSYHDRQIPFYASVAEALTATQPEVAYIAATAPAHVALAESVLAAGFGGQLLIEKPIACSLAEADRLLEGLLAQPATRRVAVNFNRRGAPLYQSVKAVVRSGELGRLKHIDYKRDMKLSMKGSHYIDLINWYMGAPLATVTAELAADSSVDTRGAFFYDPGGWVEIEYASGQTARIDAVDHFPDLGEGLCLEFELGRIQVDVNESAARLMSRQGERELAAEAAVTYAWIANVFEALVSPAEPCVLCSVAEAADSLAVIVAAQWSHRHGRAPVAFPLPADIRSEVLRLA